MNILGVDFGLKVVGLALLTVWPDGSSSISPLSPLPFYSQSRIIDGLLDACRLYGAGSIVFGLPLLKDGREGGLSSSIRNLSESISTKDTKIKVFFADERLTSQAVRRDPAYLKAPRAKRRGWENSLAACLILENYLASS